MKKDNSKDTQGVVRKTAPCSCKHEYQDSKYGKGIRVLTTYGKPSRQRCTVCGVTK